MRVFHVIVQRIRSLVLGDALDADAREELRDHMDRQIDMHLASGLTPDEARRRAAIDIGGLAQLEEDCRDARGLAWWNALRGDVRYALRQMRRRPGFALAAILTIALGVSASSAVFGVVDAVLLRPLPYPDADRLYTLYEVNQSRNVGRTRAAALNFLDWREQATSFDAMAAHGGTGFTLTGRGEPSMVIGQLVTPDLLDVLKVQPMLGRGFRPDESEAGRNRVVILTHRLWQAYFSGDPAVVGSVTTINGLPYEVIGVMPASFRYPSDRYQLLTPLVTQGTVPDGPPINRNARYLTVVARLAPGVSESTGRDELTEIGRRLAEQYPESDENISIGMTALTTDLVGDTSSSLYVALAAVGILLLVACVNVAGLALARGSARSRELGIRVAIGASRGRLIRQLATEGVVLFTFGGLAGLALAAWLLTAFTSLLPATMPRVAEIGVDWRLMTFGLGLTMLSGLAFSILPALSIARGETPDLSGSRGTVSAGRRTQRTRGALIVGQVAAAMVLLAGAALALRSLAFVNRVDAGFDPRDTLTFSFVMGDARVPTAIDMRQMASRVWEALEATPGVRLAGLTTALPLSDQNIENGFTVDGSPTAPDDEPPIAGLRGVTGRYTAAIGAHVLRGRDILPTDTATSQPVVVVTADFVSRYVTAADPLGVRLKMGGPRSDDPWRTIVGVIAEIRHTALDETPRPEVWLPFAQMPDDFLTTWARGAYVAARTTIAPHAAVPDIRTTMRSIDAETALIDVMTFEDLARRSTSGRRFETSLLAAFAAIVLALAAVGLFGLLAFYVAQHVQEFGVRLALGAAPGSILSLVLRRGLWLLAVGLAIGLPGAFIMGRGLSHLLYGVEPTDPLALGVSIAVLTIVTLAACALPARRAMRTDPLVALRTD